MFKRISLSKKDNNKLKEVTTIGGIKNEVHHNNKSFKFPWKIILNVTLSLLGLFVIVLIVVYFVVIRPVLNVVADAKIVKEKFYLVTVGIKEQNFTQVKTNLEEAKVSLEKFKVSYKSNVDMLRKLPIVTAYMQDADRLIAISEQAADLGTLTVSILEPYAKDIGFSVDGEKAKDITAQERVVQLIRLMPQFAPRVKEISEKVIAIDKELSQIDAKRYPNNLPTYVKYVGLPENIGIQDQILTMQALSKEVSEKSPQLEAFFNVIPDFMGLNKPKKYLVLMANNNELRTTGGFNTYLTVVQLAEGVPSILMSMDTYFIDEGARLGSSVLVNRNVCAHLSKYLYIQGRNQRLYARDATSCEVDFQLATDKLINEFWKKDRTLTQDIDGVIQVNNDVIEDLLRVVGPVKTDAFSVTTDQKTRISIPITEFNADNVTLELSNISGGKLAETIGRKDIIKFLADSILQKIFTSEASNLPNVGKVMLESMSKKDVILRSFDPNTQKAFEDLAYAGRIVNVDEETDFLYVNRSNFGSGKADWTKDGFVHQKVEKSVRFENGKKLSTVKVTIINPNRPDWFNIDPCCFYNAYLRVYVPKGSKLLQVTASDDQDPKSAEYVDEIANKTYFETFTNQKKDTSLTLTFEYELPDTINIDNYKVFIERQPGTSVDEYMVNIGDKKKDVLINSDKMLVF